MQLSKATTKLTLWLLSVAIICQAQSNLNWRGYGDTAAIANFKADTLRFSKAFNLTNGENKAVLIHAEDTANAGRGGDSINFYYGYQLGFPNYTVTGMYDTTWTQAMPIDTFSTRTAARFYNPNALTGAAFFSVDSTTDAINSLYHGVDTSSSGSNSYQWHSFVPQWAPLIRFYFKGISQNRIGKFVRVRVNLYQRKYVPTGN
jgi:hypothetical protein